jgi:hypothetical protein
MNMVARLAFRIADSTGSKVILGSKSTEEEKGADRIDPLPGRALYKLAETHEIQCPYISDKTIGGYLHELGKN